MDNAAIIHATQLYFSAESDNCIDACHRISKRATFSEDQRSQVTLLTARSMLRLEKCYEAEGVLAESAGSHATLDARVTSSMLVAMARIRRGMPDDGLQLLQKAKVQARNAHRSIRSEIELYAAYAHFARRDIDAALQAISRVNVDSDVIHARALQLQGFCQSWRSRKREAAAAFLAALVRLDTCTQRDYFVAATAIAGLSVIAYETSDSALMQIVEERYATMRWPTDASRYRHQVEANIAYHADFTGDLSKSAAFAASALRTAQANPWLKAGSYSQIARIAHHSRDHSAARTSLDASFRLLNELPDPDIAGSAEAGWAMLEVVRETSLYDVSRARALFARYKTLKSNSLNIHSGSRQVRAEETFVTALMHMAEGAVVPARQAFAEAHEVYRICGFTAEAIESAHWLTILGDSSRNWYVSGSLAGISNWMTRVHAVKIN